MAMNQENGNYDDWICMGTLNFHVCEKPTTKPKPAPTPKEGKTIKF